MASNSSIAPSDALATTAVRVAALDASQSQTPSHNASLDANIIHAGEDAGEDDAMREAITTGERGDINGGNNAGGVRDVEHNGNDEDDEDDGNGDDDDDVDEEDEDEEEGTGLESEKKHEPQHAIDVSSVDNASSKDAPNTGTVDAELEAMKKRLQQMEEETFSTQGNPKEETDSKKPEVPADTPAQNAAKGPTGGVNHAPGTEADSPAPPNPPADEATSESDARSIYVGNVDYKATGEELNQFFKECGTINRVTIMCHKATGQPKGFAYIEFKERESVQNALVLNEALFLGRPIKVVEKRTNIPALHRGGYRGRVARYVRGWRGPRRPRGRGRGRGRWAPY